MFGHNYTILVESLGSYRCPVTQVYCNIMSSTAKSDILF